MKPLEYLTSFEELERGLMGAPLATVSELIGRAEASVSQPGERAALLFARGALALRSGDLDVAKSVFDEARSAFEACGDPEASALSGLEAAVTLVRRGRPALAEEAVRVVTPWLSSSFVHVRGRAELIIGTAMRVEGDGARALVHFLRALEASEGDLALRSMTLNSLATLYVSLGAFGAATSLVSHAADLCRRRQDRVGEAIAMGQLGAAAMGLSDLEGAFKFLSRQAYLAGRVGDKFGEVRAAVWLSEVSLLSGRADDAVDTAQRAKKAARAMTPPQTTFEAYAERVIGRARIAMGDRAGQDDLARAEAIFRSQKLPLGDALTRRDLALARGARALAVEALWDLAALGLPERIAEVWDEVEGGHEAGLGLMQSAPRRLEPLEAELATEPTAPLERLALPRGAARKNLARLSVLSLDEKPGYRVLATRFPTEQALIEFMDRAGAPALLASVGSCAVFAFAKHTGSAAVAGQIEALTGPWLLRTAGDLRVVSAGFGGGPLASLVGLDPAELLESLLGGARGAEDGDLASSTQA